MTYTLECNPETMKILDHAERDLARGNITRDQYNDVVMMCITTETEADVLKLTPSELCDTIAV